MSLRRILLELRVEELAPMLGESLLRIDSMSALTFLRDSQEDTTLICRVRFKDKTSSPRNAIRIPGVEIQLIEREEKNTYVILLKNRRRTSVGERGKLSKIGMYLSTPYEIREGKVRMTFIGSTQQTRKTLHLFSQSGIHYRIISLSDAKFGLNSPLSSLTEKQRKVLITAYERGYYDLPKKASSEKLAERLDMRSSTFVVHRIKAEKRILDAILKKE